MSDLRIPFGYAIADPQLLKTAWDELSWPQRITLKAFYGLPLSDNVVNPATKLSEIDYWSMIQGHFKHDYLGYPTEIQRIPYVAKEYNQLWAIIGRRAGKTSQLQSFIIAYEACLGGHEQYIKKGQECVIYLIAQKLEVAELNMPFVREIINSSPLLANSIVNEIQGKIVLDNGISIMPSSPSIKSQRGLAVPVVAMDEVSFWYNDADSAHPDFEVERAVAKSQMQFPNYKRIGISTPWNKEGLLWKYYKAGTEGQKYNLSPDSNGNQYRGKLVVFGTTASFENPLLKRDRLHEEWLEDQDGFSRECLCVFPDSVSGFLGRQLVERAFQKATGIAERTPVDMHGDIVPMYVAAIDPAFRQDSFGFVILHKDSNNNIIVDVLRQWIPIRGTKLNPRDILTEIKLLAEQFNIQTLYSDQYQLESMTELALDLGMNIDGVDFTGKSKAKIFGSLQTVINQQKIEILDPNLSEAAQTLFNELIALERRRTPQGNTQISAPEGKHDDMASCLALACTKATWMNPIIQSPAENEFREKTAFEKVQETLRRHSKFEGDY